MNYYGKIYRDDFYPDNIKTYIQIIEGIYEVNNNTKARSIGCILILPFFRIKSLLQSGQTYSSVLLATAAYTYSPVYFLIASNGGIVDMYSIHYVYI